MGKVLKFPIRPLTPVHQKNKCGQGLILLFKLKPLNLNERIKNDVDHFKTSCTN